MDPRDKNALCNFPPTTTGQDVPVDDDDDYDFGRSLDASNLPPLEQQPDVKYFYLQLAVVKSVQATRFTKESVYSKIGRSLLLEEGS